VHLIRRGVVVALPPSRADFFARPPLPPLAPHFDEVPPGRGRTTWCATRSRNCPCSRRARRVAGAPPRGPDVVADLAQRRCAQQNLLSAARLHAAQTWLRISHSAEVPCRICSRPRSEVGGWEHVPSGGARTPAFRNWPHRLPMASLQGTLLCRRMSCIDYARRHGHQRAFRLVAEFVRSLSKKNSRGDAGVGRIDFVPH